MNTVRAGSSIAFRNIVNTASYLDLARMPVVGRFEEAFHSAMGVPVKLFPPEIPRLRLSLGPSENPLCVLVASTAVGCQSCISAQACVQRGAAKRLGVQQVSCSAGLTEVAVPVVAGHRHRATLLTGQVLRREPTQRDFELLLQMLGRSSAGPVWEKALEKAYFGTQVITAERLNAIARMLTLFAGFLSETVDSESVAQADDEPHAVARAKRFVQEHLSEPLDLGSVIRHVAMSRFYFCRLFKKTTGMTLSAYVSRSRLEKAKAMLIDPSKRISEIGYATGFTSIPRFNAVFKMHVGMAPGDYRAALLARTPDKSVSAFPG